MKAIQERAQNKKPGLPWTAILAKAMLVCVSFLARASRRLL